MFCFSQVILYLLKIKSHACFEARNNKLYQEKKYTECTYKHKIIYIYLYIYILYGPLREKEEIIMHKQSSEDQKV